MTGRGYLFALEPAEVRLALGCDAVSVGREAMNRELVATAREAGADVAFFVLFQEQLTPETIRAVGREGGVPTINWFADDHWRFDRFTRLYAPAFDWSVTTDEDSLPRYRALGVERVILSQWACNRHAYGKVADAIEHEVTFVGQAYGDRPAVIGRLVEAGFPVECWGRGWPAGKIDQDGMVRVFSSSRINVNLSSSFRPEVTLRMRLGDSLSHIYFQYDFLPSLVAVIWHWIGGDPYAYPICTEISYFLMLAGCFLVARRQFEDSRLASMLVVALCAVRIYGIVIDPNAKPQVAPLRLDLWLALLAPALWFGLRHWSVGLAAGALCFFSRSFGMIYVGSYGLALAVDFAAARMKSKDRAPFGRDLIAAVRQTIPALLLTAAGIGAAWLVFGGPVSEAVAMYQRLGLGMLRIAPESFYWWIAPALAVTPIPPSPPSPSSTRSRHQICGRARHAWLSGTRADSRRR